MRRQESFPWIIVMGGAVLYWTIALGIGIPSLYRLLGPPGPAHRAAAVEARCVQAMSVDGKPIVFGDCFNIRFVPDVPEAVNDFVQTVPYRSGSRMTGPDQEVETPTWNPTPLELEATTGEGSDSIGRTSY